MPKLNKYLKVTLLSCVLSLSVSTDLAAKPEMSPLGENIAETGSDYYSFQTKEFYSADKKRIYTIWLGLPKQSNSQQKHAAVFMLDGNSAMSYLNDTVLKNMIQKQSPVLVAIGYKTRLPFESASRSLDYTPADPAMGKPAPDPRNPERMSGGSNEFRKILLSEIVPWVETNVQLDNEKRALWGHSYGGLFVLDTLLETDYFSHYFAASPSLAWADQRIMKKIELHKIKSPSTKHLFLMEGDVAVQVGQSQSTNFDAESIYKNRQVLSQLGKQGVDARLLIYPDLKHGAVFKASLLDVLLKNLF